jgi:tetratricopeptide (TPR) repeat protein
VRVRTFVGVLAVVAGLARAQDADPLDPIAFAARSVTRLALLDLRTTTKPTEDDYHIASQMLSIARDLAPEDQEILRCRLEAAYACGDDEQVLELTRALLNADPQDTVAQLRLITAKISKDCQNADQRIAVYEQFLDPNGKGKLLDASVRSRLALDEALLLRERGDDAGFIRKLTQAVSLDSSHKEAAQLAATVYAERNPSDRVGCLRFIENVLMADPVDANIHISIAHELAAGGAYKAAERFMDNAHAISTASGVPTDRLQIEIYALRWRSHGPGDVVAQLNHELAVVRDQAARAIQSALEKGQPTERLQKPEDVRLTPGLRFLYMAALDAAGEGEAAQAAVQDLSRDLSKSLSDVRKKVDDREATEEQYSRAALDFTGQLHLVRLLTAQQVDLVQKDEKVLDTFDRVGPELGQTIAGWLAVRTGDPARGRAILEPLTDSSPIAHLGIGLSYELEGNKDQAIATYRAVAQAHPMEVVGAWADTHATKLGAKPDPDRVAALEAVARDIPDFVDHLVDRPQGAQQLRVSVSQGEDPLERSTLHLSLQNLSNVPLALGPDRPISSRFLIAPKFEAASRIGASLVQPEVIDLDRRLRLMPQEKLEADVWADPGQTGWLMEGVAATTLRIRWRVVQGFQLAPGGGFNPGVMGLTAESDAVVLRPIAEATLPPDALATRIGTEPAAILPRLAAAVRTAALRPIFVPTPKEAAAPREPGAARKPVNIEEGPSIAASKEVAEAFAARYPKLPPAYRTMLVAVLPHARLAPAMATVDQVMRAETDPVPLCIVLATRIIDPADELLAKCRDSDDPRVRDMAVHVRARLETGVKCYAKLVAAELAPPPAPGAAK